MPCLHGQAGALDHFLSACIWCGNHPASGSLSPAGICAPGSKNHTPRLHTRRCLRCICMGCTTYLGVKGGEYRSLTMNSNVAMKQSGIVQRKHNCNVLLKDMRSQTSGSVVAVVRPIWWQLTVSQKDLRYMQGRMPEACKLIGCNELLNTIVRKKDRKQRVVKQVANSGTHNVICIRQCDRLIDMEVATWVCCTRQDNDLDVNILRIIWKGFELADS